MIWTFSDHQLVRALDAYVADLEEGDRHAARSTVLDFLESDEAKKLRVAERDHERLGALDPKPDMD